ncbi:hypothetical protein [Streptomyces sp. NPDC096152]|uniref:hypothetical protein n=1 Tax=Streptomyces sp. NPDC096152 TaxID=3366078 RepID=UPI0037F204AD
MVSIEECKDTVLYPGQEIPTIAEGPQYTERDLYVSDETRRILEETDPTDSGPMRAFMEWCAEQGRVAVPCTTATFTEYGRYLMQRGLKASTIKNYMSRIKTAMPAGKKPDNSLYLRLLADYRKNNRRAVRTRQAFPITLPYLVPKQTGGRSVSATRPCSPSATSSSAAASRAPTSRSRT